MAAHTYAALVVREYVVRLVRVERLHYKQSSVALIVGVVACRVGDVRFDGV